MSTHDKGDEGILAGINDKAFLDGLLCKPADGVTPSDVQRLLWMAVAMQERLGAEPSRTSGTGKSPNAAFCPNGAYCTQEPPCLTPASCARSRPLSAVRTQAGWKLVPLVPTDEMEKAAAHEDNAYSNNRFTFPSESRFFNVYAAMLRAAPPNNSSDSPSETGANGESRTTVRNPVGEACPASAMGPKA